MFELDYLSSLNNITISKEVAEKTEMVWNMKKKHKYAFRKSTGELICYALKEKDNFALGTYNFHIVNTQKQELMIITIKYSRWKGAVECIEVFAGNEMIIGGHLLSINNLTYEFKEMKGEFTIIGLERKFIKGCHKKAKDYEVHALDGKTIGQINFNSPAAHHSTGPSLSVEFSPELDVKRKAAILGYGFAMGLTQETKQKAERSRLLEFITLFKK